MRIRVFNDLGAGAMAQQLRALTSLLEDKCLDPSTHNRRLTNTWNSSPRESDGLLEHPFFQTA